MATVESDQTAAALEHCYDRFVRGHFRAWAGIVRERRVWRKGVKLLVKGREAVELSTAFRRWRHRVAQVRQMILWNCRMAVRVWDVNPNRSMGWSIGYVSQSNGTAVDGRLVLCSVVRTCSLSRRA